MMDQIHFEPPEEEYGNIDDIVVQAQGEIRVFANAGGTITIYADMPHCQGHQVITIDPSKVEALVKALRHVKKHGFK